AARRGAEIEAGAAARVDAEVVERSRQLLAAARGEAPPRTSQPQLRLGAHPGTGLVDAFAVDQHLAGEDQRLRLGARLRESGGDQALVEPRALQPRSSSSRAARATPAAS